MLSRLAVIPMLFGTLIAAEPVLISETTIPDVQRAIERAKAGPYGTIWNLPEMEFVRSEITTQLEQALSGETEETKQLIGDIKSILIHQYALDLDEETISDSTMMALLLPTQANKALAFIKKKALEDGDDDIPVAQIGQWIVIGRQPANPATLAIPQGHAEHDVFMRNDASSFQSNENAPKEVKSLQKIIGLTRVESMFRFNENGTSEQLTCPGMTLPLRAIDTSTFASLPADQLIFGTVGIDGEKCVDFVTRLRADNPSFDRDIKRFDEQGQAMGGLTMNGLLMSLNGTAWLSVTPGAPFPAFTVGIPASPKHEEWLRPMAEGMGIDLAKAKDAAIPLPLPDGAAVPFMVQLRRTATHWVVTSDQRVLDAIAANKPGGFKLPTMSPTTAAIWEQDTAGLLKYGMGYLPLAASLFIKSGPQDEGDNGPQKMLAKITRVMNAALPHIHKSSLVVETNAKGVVAHGKNAITSAMPVLGAAAMLFVSLENSRSVRIGPAEDDVILREEPRSTTGSGTSSEPDSF